MKKVRLPHGGNDQKTKWQAYRCQRCACLGENSPVARRCRVCAFRAYSNQDAAPFGLSTEKIANILRQVPDQQEGLEFIQLKLDSSFALYPLWQQKNT